MKKVIVEFDINENVIAVWTPKEFNEYIKSKPLFAHTYFLEFELNQPKDNGEKL